MLRSLFTPQELANTLPAYEWYARMQQDAEERYGEEGYERHLENQGYNEARLQEDMERAQGIEEWPYPQYT